MQRLKIGVYGPNGSALVAAVLEGLETIGHRPEHLYHATFSAGNVAGGFDAIVTCGTRGKLAEIAQHYGEAEVPVLQIGEPLLHEEGRRLVVRGDLPGWLPAAEAPDSAERLEALGIEVAVKKRVKAQVVLVLGQPASATVTRVELAEWFDETVSTLRRVCDSRIVYLPAAEDDSRGTEEVDEILPAGSSATEAFDRSWLTVTHSSPLGLAALIAGLPVVDAGGTVYSALGGSLQRFTAIKPPPQAAVEGLLRAVLAAQWTLSQIETGEAFVAALEGEQFEPDASTPTPVPVTPVVEPLSKTTEPAEAGGAETTANEPATVADEVVTETPTPTTGA